MKIPFTGGCMCGAIRYKCAVEPIAMGVIVEIVSELQGVPLPPY